RIERVGPPGLAAGGDHVVALREQLAGELQPQAPVGAGDEDVASGHLPSVRTLCSGGVVVQRDLRPGPARRRHYHGASPLPGPDIPTFRSALRPAVLSFAFVLATGLAGLAAMARAADEVAVGTPSDPLPPAHGPRVGGPTHRQAPIVAVNVSSHAGGKAPPNRRSGPPHRR